MDLSKIKSIVSNQLTNISDIDSLKIQNHIYGCFIIMEDIAQHTIDFSDTIISTPKFTFDLDKQFGEIGIRFGFVMDTKLTLNTFLPEYKNIWIQFFKDIDITQDINEVDKIEDCLIELIQLIVPSNLAFFINSLNTGSLPQEWIEKILLLLDSKNNNKVLKNTKTINDKSRRYLATTRRSCSTIQISKKTLAKTRRHHTH